MIFFGEHCTVGFGDGMLGDVGDLLAYRQMWEPYIAAQLALWRDMNARFERTEFAKLCPPGIFENAQISKNLDATSQSYCASLALTRMMTSDTDPRGILPRWNAWANKSSAEILTSAVEMLKWHQSVVMQVGGPDKDRLVEIAKVWEISIVLPDLPSFSTQQEVISRIQGAYVATKGILGVIGYGAAENLKTAADVSQAVSEGLKDTAKSLPSTTKWIGIAAAVAAVFVGGALIVYYFPKKTPEPTLT